MQITKHQKHSMLKKPYNVELYTVYYVQYILSPRLYCTLQRIPGETSYLCWFVVLFFLSWFLHCSKSNPNFSDITWKVENMILHEIFQVVSSFPRYHLCYNTENNFLWNSKVGLKPFDITFFLSPFLIICISSCYINIKIPEQIHL